jgi:hypothetical protein
VAKHNNLSGSWFADKQGEYASSSLLSTQLLNHDFSIGVNTAVNKVKSDYGFNFDTWDANAIQRRQALLLELALDTWTINNRRLDTY